MMIKNLGIPESQLSIADRLLTICKKPGLSTDRKHQIDFLLLDRQMQNLQGMQSRTVQQIVQFVDEHLDKFKIISGNFAQIQANVQQSELIIRKLIPKLDFYKSKLYAPQNKIQQFMAAYQKQIMQQQLILLSRQQAQFLLKFVREFQNIGNLNVQQLNNYYKFNIVRLLRKKQYIFSIFQHPLLQGVSSNLVQFSIMLANILQQLQFYFSEQLSRIVASSHTHNQKYAQIIQQIHIWYKCLNKESAYFQKFQQSVVGRKLSSLQLLVVSHKQSLTTGNDENIMKQFFHQMFELVQKFPQNFPSDRIFKLIYKFLGKKQLSFLYSYVAPTFPIAFSAYKESASKLKNPILRKQFQTKHVWNLKMWADLRIKTILDRSGKDKTKNLAKWLQIVFKKNFMIYGVKSYMIKLAFLLVSRHNSKLIQQYQFTSLSLNDNYNLIKDAIQVLTTKLPQSFDEQIKNELNQQIIKNNIDKIINNVESSMKTALKKWILINFQMTITACKNSLQNYKSLVLSIISKKQKQKLCFNSQQLILKPLRSYFKNNPQIQYECSKFVEQIILQQVSLYYSTDYARQVYNHSHSNVLPDQMKAIMNVITYQKENLFKFQPTTNIKKNTKIIQNKKQQMKKLQQ